MSKPTPAFLSHVRKIADPEGVFRRKFQTDHPQNYGRHTALSVLIAAPGFAADVWNPLVQARRIEASACPYETACEVIDAACIEPSVFIDSSPKGEVSKSLDRYSTRIDTFKQAVADLQESHLWDIQRRSDEATGFHSTGRHVNVDALFCNLHAHLDLLQTLIALPPPPPSNVTPRKVNAARSEATTRAKVLKHEIGKRYTQKHHGVIATIVSTLDNLDPPFTEGDVSKA